MDIDEDLVRDVARLARLELTEAEVRTIVPQLARIFAHVDRLQQLDVGTAEPAPAAPVGMASLRDDVAGPTLDPETALRGAPARDGAFLVVPRFLDDDEA